MGTSHTHTPDTAQDRLGAEETDRRVAVESLRERHARKRRRKGDESPSFLRFTGGSMVVISIALAGVLLYNDYQAEERWKDGFREFRQNVAVEMGGTVTDDDEVQMPRWMWASEATDAITYVIGDVVLFLSGVLVYGLGSGLRVLYQIRDR